MNIESELNLYSFPKESYGLFSFNQHGLRLESNKPFTSISEAEKAGLALNELKNKQARLLLIIPLHDSIVINKFINNTSWVKDFHTFPDLSEGKEKFTPREKRPDARHQYIYFPEGRISLSHPIIHDNIVGIKKNLSSSSKPSLGALFESLLHRNLLPTFHSYILRDLGIPTFNSHDGTCLLYLSYLKEYISEGKIPPLPYWNDTITILMDKKIIPDIYYSINNQTETFLS